MEKFLPFLRWAKQYERAWLKGDLTAGFTVGIVLIPQGMAYAMIAGLPPVYGLYAAMVPQLAYMVLGTSRQLAVGPVATDSLLVFAGLSAIAVTGTAQYTFMAIGLALMVGILQLLLGILRFGFIANFLSRPVISAFVCAAGIIIGINQIKYLLGIPVLNSQNAFSVLLQLLEGGRHAQVLPLSIGVLGILILFFTKRFHLPVPGALLIVVLSIVAVKFRGLEQEGLDIIGTIPKGFPSFQVPKLAWADIRALFPTALTLAIITFMEAISVSKAMAEKHKASRLDAHQELIALGMANITGALFQSFPSSGGLSRSAINEQAGARTNLAALISAAVVALTLLFFTDWFYYLPKAVLAAIILVSVYKLIRFDYPLRLWRHMKDEFVVYALTFFITLGIGIIEGIVTGVFSALLALIYRTAHPHIAELALVEGTKHYKNVLRFSNVIRRRDVLILRFDAQLYFGNVDYFKSRLSEMVRQKGEDLRLVVLSSGTINHIDATALVVLEDIIKNLQDRGIVFYLAGTRGPTRDMLYRSGLIDILGEDALFVKTADAVAHFDKSAERQSYTLRAMATQTKK